MDEQVKSFLQLYSISLNQDDINALKSESLFKGIEDDEILNDKIIDWLKTRQGHSDAQNPDVDASSQLFNDLRKEMNW